VISLRQTALVTLLLCSVAYSAQSTLSLKKLSKFIPKGYLIGDTAFADLNNDGVSDAIAVLRVIKKKTGPCPLRPLLVIVSQKKKFKLAARNDSIVMCFNGNGKDPFTGLETHANNFTVSHLAGSSWKFTKNITFQFDAQTQRFKLFSDDGVTYNEKNPSKILPVDYSPVIGQDIKDYRNIYLRGQ
jgi:hypothetical protein